MVGETETEYRNGGRERQSTEMGGGRDRGEIGERNGGGRDRGEKGGRER